jgi:hypothetical protein
MLSANTRERLRLSLIETVLTIFLGGEYTIIPMEMLDLDVGIFVNPLLKTLLAHHSLICAQRYLVLYPNETGCGIVVNCPTIEAAGRTFATKPIR